MSSPAVRLVRMAMFIAFGGWLALMVATYMVGAHGLNFQRYITNMTGLAFACTLGFLLVWVALYLIRTSLRHPPLPVLADGTFTAMAVAPPFTPETTPLENTLIGLLQGYTQWPAFPANAATSLYAQAMRRWNLMAGLPDVTPLHRSVALASTLGIVLTTEEQRTPAAWWKLGTPDTVTFVHRAPPSGIIAAKLLASLPVFTALPPLEQSHALTSLNHMDSPDTLGPEAAPIVHDILAKLSLVIQHTG